jgi:hypothetical protein
MCRKLTRRHVLFEKNIKPRIILILLQRRMASDRIEVNWLVDCAILGFWNEVPGPDCSSKSQTAKNKANVSTKICLVWVDAGGEYLDRLWDGKIGLADTEQQYSRPYQTRNLPRSLMRQSLIVAWQTKLRQRWHSLGGHCHLARQSRSTLQQQSDSHANLKDKIVYDCLKQKNQ